MLNSLISMVNTDENPEELTGYNSADEYIGRTGNNLTLG